MQPERQEVSVLFTPALYSSMAYLGVLEQLSKEKVYVTKIFTSGFSTLLMAIYLKEKSLSKTEWSLFRLIRELKGEKPFSVNWQSKVYTFIEEEFKDTSWSDLGASLWGMSRRGNTELVLFLKNEVQLMSVGMLTKNLEELIINSGGVDIEKYYTISSLPLKLDLKFSNDFLFGNYAKVYSLLKNEKTYTIKNNFKIDDSQSLLKSLRLGKMFPVNSIKGIKIETTN